MAGIHGAWLLTLPAHPCPVSALQYDGILSYTNTASGGKKTQKQSLANSLKRKNMGNDSALQHTIPNTTSISVI